MSEDTKADGETAVSTVVRELENRARRLRWQGNLTLISAIAVLAGSVLFSYVFAAQVARTDVEPELISRISDLKRKEYSLRGDFRDAIDELQAPARELERAFKRLCGVDSSIYETPQNMKKDTEVFISDIANVLKRMNSKEWGGLRPFGINLYFKDDSMTPQKCAEELNKDADRVVSDLVDAMPDDEQEVVKRMNFLEAELNDMRSELGASEAVLKARQGIDLQNYEAISDEERAGFIERTEWRRLIQTNITRYATLILALLLVAVLFSLYRYCMRLASFYSARADALKLISLAEGQPSLETLLKLLTPNFDAGKVTIADIQGVTSVLKR